MNFLEATQNLNSKKLNDYMKLVGSLGVVCRSNAFYGLRNSTVIPADILRSQDEDVDSLALFDPSNFVETVGVCVTGSSGRTTFVAVDLNSDFVRLERDRALSATHKISEKDAVELIVAAKENQHHIAVTSYSNFSM